MKFISYGVRAALAAGLVVLLGPGSSARASYVSYSASGTIANSPTRNVSVQADFTNVGNDLRVDLFNLQAGSDPLQVLTGLVWDLDGTNPMGTLLSSARTASGSGLYTRSTTYTSNAELRNSALEDGKGWKYQTNRSLNGTAYEFGLGASGLGGAFSGLGNDDYGIIGAGSNLTLSNLNNKLPLVKSTSLAIASQATFVIRGFNADANRIRDVRFAFGSAGRNNLDGHTRLVPVPEPSSVILSAIGLVGLIGYRARRRLSARNG